MPAAGCKFIAMGINRRILWGVVSVLVAGSIVVPGALAAPPTHAKLNPGGARDFWTPKRMRSAVPLDRPADELAAAERARRGSPPSFISEAVPDPNAQPYPAVGKVFFKIDGGIFVCSAAIVDSPGRSLVWTAGHCVRDPGRRGQFASKWVFVPGYDQGSSPYGVWPAKVLWTNAGWVGKDQAFDYSAAILRPKNGQRVQKAVGSSLSMDINPAAKQDWQAVGFPAAGMFADSMWHCLSGFYRRDNFPSAGPAPIGIGCNMTGGASGGPWITEDGKLGAVTSYGYNSEPGAVYGTYLGTAANKLYKKIRKKH